jgi:hypothetical protein
MNFFGGVSLLVSACIILLEKISSSGKGRARTVMHSPITQTVLGVVLIAYVTLAGGLLVRSTVRGYQHSPAGIAVQVGIRVSGQIALTITPRITWAAPAAVEADTATEPPLDTHGTLAVNK